MAVLSWIWCRPEGMSCSAMARLCGSAPELQTSGLILAEAQLRTASAGALAGHGAKLRYVACSAL